jgi:hypothetical protein
LLKLFVKPTNRGCVGAQDGTTSAQTAAPQYGVQWVNVDTGREMGQDWVDAHESAKYVAFGDGHVVHKRRSTLSLFDRVRWSTGARRQRQRDRHLNFTAYDDRSGLDSALLAADVAGGVDMESPLTTSAEERPSEFILTGTAFDYLKTSEPHLLGKLLFDVRIFARFSPEQKAEVRACCVSCVRCVRVRCGTYHTRSRGTCAGCEFDQQYGPGDRHVRRRRQRLRRPPVPFFLPWAALCVHARRVLTDAYTTHDTQGGSCRDSGGRRWRGGFCRKPLHLIPRLDPLHRNPDSVRTRHTTHAKMARHDTRHTRHWAKAGWASEGRGALANSLAAFKLLVLIYVVILHTVILLLYHHGSDMSDGYPLPACAYMVCRAVLIYLYISLYTCVCIYIHTQYAGCIYTRICCSSSRSRCSSSTPTPRPGSHDNGTTMALHANGGRNATTQLLIHPPPQLQAIGESPQFDGARLHARPGARRTRHTRARQCGLT